MADWEELTFISWEALSAIYGRNGRKEPPSLIGRAVVLHLIEEDIYLDVRFDSWAEDDTGGGEKDGAGADPRDLLTEDPDLALVRDLEDVRFYEDATGFSVAALPWDRLYLLVMPPEANPGGTDAWRAAARNVDPERDVTGVSSRSWDSIVLPAGGREACPQMSGPVNTGASARLEWGLDQLSLDGDTVVFPGDDTGAREFAHRLAALAGGRTRAVAMPPEALCFALQWQMPGAVVLPLDLDFPTGCLQLATLLGKAAWLQEAALDNAPAPIPNSLGDADRLAPRPGDPYQLVAGREASLRRAALSGTGRHRNRPPGRADRRCRPSCAGPACEPPGHAAPPPAAAP